MAECTTCVASRGALTGRRAASGLGMSRQVRTARISVKRVKSQKHPQSAVGPDVDNEAQVRQTCYGRGISHAVPSNGVARLVPSCLQF